MVWAVNTYVASYEGRDLEKSSPPAATYSCLTRKGTKGSVHIGCRNRTNAGDPQAGHVGFETATAFLGIITPRSRTARQDQYHEDKTLQTLPRHLPTPHRALSPPERLCTIIEAASGAALHTSQDRKVSKTLKLESFLVKQNFMLYPRRFSGLREGRFSRILGPANVTCSA